VGTSLVGVITVGVDIGGTKIAAAAVDERGTVVARARRDTPEEHAAAILHTVAEMVRELAGRTQVGAVGVAAAGFVDSARASVVFAPNLPWRDEPLRDLLQAEVDLPVVIENDANAAAWGEFRFGAGREADDMVLVTIGTGIGGGVVSDGALLRGGYGMAAEIGHLRVVPGGLLCGCGNRGCWEQYGSGSALTRRARELAAAEPDRHAALLALAGGDAREVEGEMVTAAAEAGDEAATALMTDFGSEFGETLASLVAVLDPELVVIGGGASQAGDLLLHPIRQGLGSHLMGRGHRPQAPVIAARLGNDAGMIGAADLARDVLPGGRRG
jgi:glucokinase